MKSSKEKLLGTLFLLSAGNCVMAQERPNIVFILTDDQPYSLLHCTGNKLIQTPNLDKLAKEGVLFTNAHVSSAISTPSRTCILTGRYERNHGVNFNSGTSLSAEAWRLAYPCILRANGYYTGYVGKNHTPIGDRGYETGLMDNSYDYWYGGHEHLGFYPKEKHKIFKNAKNNTQVEILEEGMLDFLNPNERSLKGAVSFLEGRPKDKPFFLNLCFNLPHGNGTGSMKLKESDPDIYKTLYRNLDIQLPENYIAKADIKTPKLPESVHHASDRQNIYNYCDNPKTLRKRNIREMQAVTGIDKLVGKLMDELKKQGLDKNTIIVYTSDHGIFNGEFGLGGKALCYEYCTHVPLIIYDPTLPKSLRSKDNNELVLALDLAPTFLDYAKAEKPANYQGFSLKPMLSGKIKSVRDYLFTENLWSTHFGNPRCESIQDKKWKYIRYYKNENLSATEKIKHLKSFGLSPNNVYKTDMTDVLMYRIFVDAGLNGENAEYEELYDLENDPKETTNLANDKKYKDILENLRTEWFKALKLARGNGKPMVDIICDGYSIPK
ncbi:sulfatase-like hydrolase/transferase [Bacteroides xylanisolvens]|uniref:sulfatase-like hydrolase/transferase n=1 Tax=Bacteroides xylanisolvens TaxID=371601 RepID=UPI003515273A